MTTYIHSRDGHLRLGIIDPIAKPQHAVLKRSRQPSLLILLRHAHTQIKTPIKTLAAQLDRAVAIRRRPPAFDSCVRAASRDGEVFCRERWHVDKDEERVRAFTKVDVREPLRGAYYAALLLICALEL